MRKSALAMIAVAGVMSIIAVSVGSASLGIGVVPAAAAPMKLGEASGPGVRSPTVTPVRGPAAVRMGHYGLGQFAAGARRLPTGLTSQLRKQLGISGAQFLADGQAAADASKVIAALRTHGVDVTGSEMNGTALTVYVPDATDATAAEAAGATAIVGTQGKPEASPPTFNLDGFVQRGTSPGAGTSPLLGGDGWAYFTSDDGEMSACSVGFLGYDAARGSREFATAGHCADPANSGSPKPSGDPNGVNGSVYSMFDANPDPEDAENGIPVDDAASHTIGVLNTSAFKFGHGDDYGTVPVTDRKTKPQNAVTTWGGSSSSGSSSGIQNTGTPVSIIGAEAPISKSPVCHSGDRTGWQCGTILPGRTYVATPFETASGTQTVNGFYSTLYVCEGDSGGSIVSGQYAVGTLTGGAWPEPSNGTCASEAASKALAAKQGEPSSELLSVGFSLVAPATVPNGSSFAADDPGFELGVTEPATTPRLALGAGAGIPTALSGTLAFPGNVPAPAGTAVALTVDGVASTTTSVANSSGVQAWRFALSNLSPGSNTYTLTIGTGHSAVSRSGAFDSPMTVSTPAITGTTKVGDALAVGGVTTSPNATVTSYQWYDLGTDGTTSTPIAGATAKTFTPSAGLARHELAVTATVTELGAELVSAQSPATVPLTGGPVLGSASISGAPTVGNTLTANAGGEISGSSLTYRWRAGGTAIAGATGKTLKLTGAQLGDPITVTISGSQSGYTSASKTSAATAAVAPSVTRVAGPDRWATAVAASKAQFPSGASTVFIASGENYPDALSAAPAAAKTGGDLLLTAPAALPSSVANELRRLTPRTVYLIGGTGAISAAVASRIRDVTGVTPTRVFGANRYGTNAAILAKFFPSASAVFAATGAGFPDALSAAGAAAGARDPVLLVPGTSAAPSRAEATQLSRLKPSVVYVVGGTAVMSSSMQRALAKTARAQRLAGADRYGTSVAVAKEFHSRSANAVIASGANFPDALVGSVLAGSDTAPLVLSSPICMPHVVATELKAMRAGVLMLMGGANGLSAAVAEEKAC